MKNKTFVILFCLISIVIVSSAQTPFSGIIGTIVEDESTPFSINIDTLVTTGGVAITGIPSEGGWSFWDGSTWWDFRRIQEESPISDTNALLLPENTPIRYSPPKDFYGTAYFEYKTWDGNTGTPYFSGNTSTGEEFGTTTYRVELTVTPVNDAPKLTGNKFVLNFDGANDLCLFSFYNNGWRDDF